MPAIDLSAITVGGPCKITDNGSVIYTEGNVIIEPKPTFRDIESAVAGQQDQVLVDLTYSIRFTPKPIWDATYRGVLLPSAFYNFTTTGGRVLGNSNRTVVVQGSDGEQFSFARGIVTKMPDLFLGLGKSLYSEVEHTCYIKNGASLDDSDAFYTFSTGVAWSQADFPTGHQEALCSLAWGSVTGWDSVFAEDGFTLSHELKLEAIKQGNVTVDQRITGYRGMLSFTPQGPTTVQILAALALQGTNGGIGSRQSARANDAVITGSGISVTLLKSAVNKGPFNFDNKLTRHGQLGLITALTAPGDRLTLA